MAFELKLSGTVHAVEPPLQTHCFNGGLVRAWDRLLAVYRVNRRPSLLAVSELDDDLQPVSTRILWDLWDSQLIPEDPRVIFHDGNLYVTWTGVSTRDYSCATICHAGIDADYRTIWKAPCWFAWQDRCEKNWVPFVREGKLFCIYDWNPLTVLRYDGGAWRMEFAKKFPRAWRYGRMSGGAPPVWRNGRWYVIFHSSQIEQGVKIYYAGCCAFDEEFNLLAMTEEPILAGTPHVCVKPEELPWRPGSSVSAVFPCGAIVRGDEWLVSYGYLDSELRIARFSTAALDDALGLNKQGAAS